MVAPLKADVEFDNSCARRRVEVRGSRFRKTLLISVSLPGRRLEASRPHQSKTQGYAVGFACEEVAKACPRRQNVKNVFNATESGLNAELLPRPPPPLSVGSIFRPLSTTPDHQPCRLEASVERQASLSLDRRRMLALTGATKRLRRRARA